MDVILVNEQDEQVGTMEKMEVHQKGLLHRAFSVFIYNAKGEMLLQQRAAKKYHSANLWSNTCCSHPAPGENINDAAAKRLQEEMGFNAPLKKVFDFIYEAPFDNNLTEHEFDHVYVGYYDGPVHPDKDEVGDYCYMKPSEIRSSMLSHPQKYTAWFKIAFPKLEDYLANLNQANL